MIKINPLDAHDRMQHFTNQSFSISECCQDLIKQEPFGKRPFYIFSHARTLDLDERIAMLQKDIQNSLFDPTYIRLYMSLEQVPNKKIIWQPRLSKPKAQTNSMLFKAYPGTDNIKVIWMIPDREMWPQYEKGKMTENKTIYDSIQSFQYERALLENPENDDPSEEEMDMIYKDISSKAKYHKRMSTLYGSR